MLGRGDPLRDPLLGCCGEPSRGDAAKEFDECSAPSPPLHSSAPVDTNDHQQHIQCYSKTERVLWISLGCVFGHGPSVGD